MKPTNTLTPRAALADAAKIATAAGELHCRLALLAETAPPELAPALADAAELLDQADEKLTGLHIKHAAAPPVPWRPELPPGFPLSLTDRGYVARIGGRTRWVCGRLPPAEALAVYRRMRGEAQAVDGRAPVSAC